MALRLNRCFYVNQNGEVPVYDIVDAEPENSFLTANFVPHNCLGLGYGAGWERFIDVAWDLARVDITEGDDDFAVRFSVDHKIHRRAKVAGSWRYESAPEGVEVDRLPSDVVVAEADFEKCCFIEKQKGKDTLVVPVTVYGMRSRVTVQSFRETNPEIRDYWRQIDAEIRDASGGDLKLSLANGDALEYKRVSKARVKRLDPDSGEEYESSSCSAMVGSKRKGLYGAKAVENITQATARHIFCERVLALIDAGYRVLFTVHDEAVLEVPDPGPDKKAQRAVCEKIESIMSVPPAWMPTIPLAAEAKILTRYAK